MHKNTAESGPFVAPDPLFTPQKQHPSQPSAQSSTPFVPPNVSIPLQQQAQHAQKQNVKQNQQNDEDTDEPTDDEQSNQKSSPSFLSIIGFCIIACIIALIGLIVFYLYKRKCKSNDSSDDDETESPPQHSQPNPNTIIETYRKNDAILKHQLSEYEQRLRAYEHKIAELSKKADPSYMIQQHRLQHNLPTEDDYEDAPIKPKEVKTEEEKNPKEKRDELVRMMNQPRRTIQDDIDEQNELKEATRQQQDEKTTEILSATTNADKIFTSSNDVDENDLIAAITNGGVVKE